CEVSRAAPDRSLWPDPAIHSLRSIVMSTLRRLPVLALAALSLAASAGTARAADVPFAGTWKVTVYDGPQIIHLALIKVEDADGKPTAKMANAGLPAFA